MDPENLDKLDRLFAFVSIFAEGVAQIAENARVELISDEQETEPDPPSNANNGHAVVELDKRNEELRASREKARAEYEADPWGYEWRKPQEVMAHFSVSRSTVYRWVKQGCPTKRLWGGTVRFQFRPLIEWLEVDPRQQR